MEGTERTLKCVHKRVGTKTSLIFKYVRRICEERLRHASTIFHPSLHVE